MRTLQVVARLALAQALVAASWTPAWAQRRREEPEANPQFQQEGGRPPAGSGAPVETAPPEEEPAAPAAPAAAPPAAEEEEAGGKAAAQGIQIGAVSGSRASAAGVLNPLDTRVSVRVKGAPLATFLDTISAQAKINFIITEGLETKPVTAFLQNVTVREALQVLLEIKGLTYQQIGKSNTYVITPRSKTAETLITRIYTLSYIPLISIEGTTGGAAGGQETGVSFISVIKSVLSKGGQVALEPRTNAIIVTDIPEVFPQVEQLIAELDRKAPQVMIEAQIVEIQSNRSRDLGFEWGGTNGELASFQLGMRDTSFPLNLPTNLGKARFFDPVTNVVSALGAQSSVGITQTATVADGTAGAAAAQTQVPIIGSGLQTSLLDLTSLRVVLRALVTRSEARFLGKPKILTLNNKSAVIQIANSQALARQSQQTTVGTVGAQAVTTAERANTGLVLRVTPQVNKEGYITMLVQPSFTDVVESNISVPGNQVFDTINRSASTLVRVKNGQTLVLGGLLQSTESKVTRKIPFLGYIPLLGWLFTTNSMRRKNSDLVIFITPTIVSD